MSEVNSALASILRAQAWERAKGELSSMLVTYYKDDRFDRIDAIVAEFVKTVDDEGLAE
jgi:hypothetical protein